MKKITLRTAKGWSKPVENKQRTICDLDGARLFQAPHGGIYCDKIHEGIETEASPETR